MAPLETGPGQLLPDRVVLGMTLAVAIALVLTVVIALVIWHTPAMHPIEIPKVPRA